ncbi:hypothetical protein SAMN02799636_03624 [Methylobacterium sp. 275MFSha3.1]|uniref:hypothetical protein n=1 Tax=Methylobacterium sp. 275MFSha3.1 TaxID=1502746 RepID=UPI0008A78298|nr:hypothetical protein [Methylobacterium sp. 275MFSha3.1]SEH72741.1 hypothetical protein SAMN02799636_03624 [Methylobacterium sp. 275MFSha3.1]
MKSLALSCVLALASVFAASSDAETARPAQERPLADAVFVRPLYGTYRHCGGSCLKSGELSWFCFARQSCHLSCATAPPQMKCAAP